MANVYSPKLLFFPHPFSKAMVAALVLQSAAVVKVARDSPRSPRALSTSSTHSIQWQGQKHSGAHNESSLKDSTGTSHTGCLDGPRGSEHCSTRKGNGFHASLIPLLKACWTLLLCGEQNLAARMTSWYWQMNAHLMKRLETTRRELTILEGATEDTTAAQ